jgi:hypothetical protein
MFFLSVNAFLQEQGATGYTDWCCEVIASSTWLKILNRSCLVTKNRREKTFHKDEKMTIINVYTTFSKVNSHTKISDIAQKTVPST